MMRTRRRMALFGAVAVVALLGAACSREPTTFPEDSFAIAANADIGVGPSRLLVAVLQTNGARLGSPEEAVEFQVAPIDEPAHLQRVPGTFTWMIEGAVGLYRADFEFDRPGPWQVTVIPETGDALDPVPFVVRESTLTPNVGEPAPASPTPTLADHSIEELTTDRNPDERFYETSLEEAVSSGQKTVLVFSTPAFCQTAACGPLLQNAKELAPNFPEVNFVHVEVYTDLLHPDFVPTPDFLAPAAGPDYWNLPSEPWAFLIDEEGLVEARFEGVMDPSELAAYLQAGY